MRLPQKDRKLAVKAVWLGVMGAVASIFAWPFGLLALPFVLAYWVSSTGFVAFHRPRFILVTSLIPNVVAAGIPLTILLTHAWLCGSEEYLHLVRVGQYCLVVGIVVSLMTSMSLSLTDECKPE